MNLKKISDTEIPSIMEFVREHSLDPADVLNEIDQYLSSDQCDEFIQHCKKVYDID